MKLLITGSFIHMAFFIMAQSSIKVEVSADTIQPGEIVEVIYTIENGEGRFEAPELSGLPLISGPNTSSSFMIQNGKKSSSQSYTYIFRPQGEGNIVIREAYYYQDDKKEAFEPITIVVSSKYNNFHGQDKSKQSQSSKVNREKKKF